LIAELANYLIEAEMGKRKPLLSDEILADVWNIKSLDYAEDELKDFDMLISSAVSRCLSEDEDSKATIAGLMSLMLGADVPASMLDAYASPARRSHTISAHRFLILIAVTRRFDVLDAILREVGGKALDRSDSSIFQLGKAYVNTVNADRELRSLKEALWATP